ncbi:NAD(P)-binding domain-containing protein [Streptomyces sp. NPDC006879]|uniref:NAD(P)-binding domain-containing protein n=1 Tax=Streptomyces sp. NPDC006879 TaxID=3364767 RepID=UPI0036A53E0C
MHDLVVIGAGPYGLSVAAHAATAGLDVKVLGRPMATWRDHMPQGMFLKSEPWASNLSTPLAGRTLGDYCATRAMTASHGNPLPIEVFSSYGLWFAGQAVPALEERTVTSVVPYGAAFKITTGDGGTLVARAVAVAVGVLPFARYPRALLELPDEHYSHSTGHHDLGRFQGQDVTVLGGGQAAMETAVLLAENGARPRLVARAGQLRWNTPVKPLARSPLRALRDPHSGLGTGWRNWAYARTPWAVRRLPAELRNRIAERALGPAGAWWLRERFEGQVPVLLGRRLRAAAFGKRVRLELHSADGPDHVLETGHVIAATGFVPDLGRLRLLDGGLRDSLRRVAAGHTPELNGGFESSHPGLFFAGLLAAPSFGPSMRFVHGADFAARSLVRGVRKHLGRRGARRTGAVAPQTRPEYLESFMP